MKPISASALRELIGDIEMELHRIEAVSTGIQAVREEIDRDRDRQTFFYESLALKLHNFYTGCERIFQFIISELNGALPSGYDWHKRVLERMANPRDDRPAVLTQTTARSLQEYLGFRHVVRNLYGFELESERLDRLAENQNSVWQQFDRDIRNFINWLHQLANNLETK